MMRSVREGLEGRDLALLLVDVTRRFGDEDAFALDLLKSAARAEGASPEGEGDGSATRVPTFLILNKVDRMKDKRALLPIIDTYRQRYDFDEILPISAISGEGLPLLMNKIFERLPEGPEYFPAGQVTDQPERFQISEVIREKAMALTREEVPHTLAVQVEKLERGPRMTEISAVLYCERPGQKAILIGHRGEMIRQIGTQSREELEATLGSKVFLELHVLVREEWRENPRFLADLDWRKEVDF
jgi:GTP-binding protein Era